DRLGGVRRNHPGFRRGRVFPRFDIEPEHVSLLSHLLDESNVNPARGICLSTTGFSRGFAASYAKIPIRFATRPSTSSARSICCCVCSLLMMVRIRALPSATVG